MMTESGYIVFVLVFVSLTVTCGNSQGNLYVGEACSPFEPNDETPGICTLFPSCVAAIREVVEQFRPHKLRRCGFERTTEIVCCPVYPATATSNRQTTPRPSSPPRFPRPPSNIPSPQTTPSQNDSNNQENQQGSSENSQQGSENEPNYASRLPEPGEQIDIIPLLPDNNWGQAINDPETEGSSQIPGINPQNQQESSQNSQGQSEPSQDGRPLSPNGSRKPSEVGQSTYEQTQPSQKPTINYRTTTRRYQPPTTVRTTTTLQPLRRSEIECKNFQMNAPPPLETHIVGGVETAPGEFPHMAALGYIKDPSKSLTTGSAAVYTFKCGGALISREFVLTAAHCTTHTLGFILSVVRLGVTDLTDGPWVAERDYNISNIHQYPDHKGSSFYYDIALIRLSEPASLSALLSPACLYNDPMEPETMIVTGWGRTSFGTGDRSERLLKINITTVSREKCSEYYAPSRRLKESIISSQLCAGGSKEQDSCQGDSGGPLQTLSHPDGQYRIVGVTSFGAACAAGVPGVYTRVYSFLDWIESIVWPQ